MILLRFKNIIKRKNIPKRNRQYYFKNTLFDLGNTYNSFFKEKCSYPKYKNKYGKNSYRTNLVTRT